VIARDVLSASSPEPAVQLESGSDAGSSSPWIAFEFQALPTELLQLIFKPLLPHPPKRTDTDRFINFAHGVGFCHYLEAFANLRLVCLTWNEVITPMLYEEIIIFLHPFPRLERMVKAFDYGAHHIRSVVLCGPSNDLSYYRMAGALIGRGLALCSHIRSLESHGSQCIFTHRRWLQKTAPQLSFTVTSLTITGAGNNLSHSLVGLGRNLQSLEIGHWGLDPSRTTPTFHLPKEMPNLTHLIIRGMGCSHISDRVQKLLERILVRRPGVKRVEVPLRSLAFFDVSLDGRSILALLRINHLCHQLTSLHISFNIRHTPYNPEFPVRLVEACPMLVDFRYIAPVDKEIFQHLRPNLRHLGFLVRVCTQSSPIFEFIGVSPSIDDLTKYLRSERARSLETLYIFLTSLRTLTLPDRNMLTSLKSVCGETGVTLSYAPTRFAPVD
jgi:hypothetical protein